MVEADRLKQLRVAIWSAVSIWLALWLYFTRYAMLDDALIHLRYAVNLHNLHYFTFNGGAPTYGASSILYVWLLSLFAKVPGVVFLPKVASVVCYVAVIAVLTALALRAQLARYQFYLWLLLLACNLSPMAVRWMSNGMETSMVSLITVAFAIVLVRFTRRASGSPITFATLFAFGFLMTLLRVELASLTVVAGVVLLLGRIDQAKNYSLRIVSWLDGIAPVLGTAAALAVVHHLFGRLLPDTAIAKSSHASIGPLFASAQVIVSSFAFGIGLLGITFLSAVLLLRQRLLRNRTPAMLLQWAAANSLFPMLVAIACQRGQAVEGIRYMAWPLLFSTVWNLLELDRLRAEEAAGTAKPDSRMLRYAAVLYAVVFVLCLPFDWQYAAHSMSGRSETFLEMKDSDLSGLQHDTIIAGDVGFIGYFTDGTICDLDGLVNGLEPAKATPVERREACARQHPEALFVTPAQARWFAQSMPLDGWVVCREVDFTNVRSNDRHYLIVPGSDGHTFCPTRNSISLQQVLHGD